METRCPTLFLFSASSRFLQWSQNSMEHIFAGGIQKTHLVNCSFLLSKTVLDILLCSFTPRDTSLASMFFTMFWRTLDIYYFFYYYWWLLQFLVRASPWTVPISGYLFNVTGSSEKIFVFNYLIKLWIYHQLINYKLIIHFHYILIYLFIYYVFKFIIFRSFQEFRIFREVRFWFWTPAFLIFQPNRRWNGHKGFCQFCGRPTISAANTDMFDLKLVFVPR